MKTVKLGEVTIKNSTIKWSAKDLSYEYIDLSSVDRDSYSIQKTMRITAKTAPSRAQKIVKKDDVLFGTTRPTLDRRCVVGEKYDGQICSTGLCVLRADKERILPKYIYHLLSTQSFKDYIEQTQRGTSYPAVTDSDVKTFVFMLPSLEEQRRVVVRLDAAFDKIDRAIELTQKNIEDTRLLFDVSSSVILGDKFEKNTKISELIKLRSGDFLPRKSMQLNGKYAVVGGNGINGCHNLYNQSGETITIGRVGEKCGNLHYYRDDIWVTDNAFFVSAYLQDTVKKYIFYALQHVNLRSYAKHTAQPVISYSGIKNIKLYIPAPEAQMQAVTEMDRLIINIDGLSEQYMRKIKAFLGLKQSMLSQAFFEGGVE